jgi:hypothetical protein
MENKEKTWAEREVEIACKKENPDRKDGEFDYGCACYESALKAYNCLMEDGHSGFSIGITKLILNRLIAGKPLTPIEDVDDVWKECDYDTNKGYTTFQCKRMSSLFKYVYDDGRVEFYDTDRVIGVDVKNNNSTYYSRLESDIVNEKFPITFPYIPSDKPYRVECKTLLLDPNNGDFDSKIMLRIVMPDGEISYIRRYFTEIDGKMTEITHSEFEALEEAAKVKNRYRTWKKEE